MMRREQFWEITAEKIQEAFENEKFSQALAIYKSLRAGERVSVFQLLDDDTQELLVRHFDVETVADLFDRLEDSETLEAAEGLPIERLADILDEMEPDEAADLLGDMHPFQAHLALDEMEGSEEILPLLLYDDQTAGGRMTTNFFSVYETHTAEEVINELRAKGPDIEFTYYVFVKDIVDHLIGVIGLRQLLVSPPNKKIHDIMDTDVVFVQADTDQEVVAQVMILHCRWWIMIKLCWG
jgi:magnesium transporter